jgi:hypothetical protein
VSAAETGKGEALGSPLVSFIMLARRVAATRGNRTSGPSHGQHNAVITAMIGIGRRGCPQGVRAAGSPFQAVYDESTVALKLTQRSLQNIEGLDCVGQHGTALGSQTVNDQLLSRDELLGLRDVLVRLP